MSMQDRTAQGPLKGLKVLELAGIGPGPFCAMMLADMGAEVLRLDRSDAVRSPAERDPRFEILNRGRRSVALDLKSPGAVELVLDLVAQSDVLIEGFRPGVMERLGLGPEACLGRNPRLIYGRMTGWGQEGPLARTAGHDINYIALTGALAAIGPEGGPPLPPLNLVGDFGGGSLYLLSGILAALFERQTSGRGQVIDAAIVDGALSLSSFLFGAHARQAWSVERGKNLLDGGRAFYRCYETADGKWISVGPIEPKFYALLLEKIGLSAGDLPQQNDLATQEQLAGQLAAIFRTRSREVWNNLLSDSDACFAPVLDLTEAPSHPHMAARGAFVEIDGVTQPSPAPRFDRTPGGVQRGAARAGEHTAEALADWDIGQDRIEALLASGAAVRRS